MQRQRIQRPGWGPGGCDLFGLHFSENFVKAIDAGFVFCFCFMVITQITDYNSYNEERECSKPFDVFWLGHFTSIAFCRLFYYLERFFYYRLALVFFEHDTNRLRRARCWAVSMMCCRLLAFCSFLGFTIIGSVWFVQDEECLSKANSEFRMACWLMISFCVCLIYALKILVRQVLAPTQLVQGDDNEHFNMFMWAGADQERVRGLTQTELNAMKKHKLQSYNELVRQTIEMSTLTTNQQIPSSGDSLELQEPASAESDEERSQFTCAVCLDNIEIDQWYKRLPRCQHCFHTQCIDDWLSTRATCPICRQKTTPLVDPEGVNHPPVRREIRIGSGNSDREPRVVLRFTRAT